MANFVLTDTQVYVHAYDLTTHTNQVSVNTEVETVDNTTFGGNGYRSRRAGLRTVEAEVSGYHDADPDAEGFTELGVVDRVVTVAADGEGSTAFAFHAGNFNYSTLGAIGEMNPFSISMQGTNATGVVRGALAKGPGSVANGSTGVKGVGVNLGAGGAGKRLYIAAHVFTAGTSLSLDVRQSTTSGGTYTAIEDFELNSVTIAGGQWVSFDASSGVTGPWYKIGVSAITGAFDFAVTLAIQ